MGNCWRSGACRWCAARFQRTACTAPKNGLGTSRRTPQACGFATCWKATYFSVHPTSSPCSAITTYFHNECLSAGRNAFLFQPPCRDALRPLQRSWGTFAAWPSNRQGHAVLDNSTETRSPRFDRQIFLASAKSGSVARRFLGAIMGQW